MEWWRAWSHYAYEKNCNVAYNFFALDSKYQINSPSSPEECLSSLNLCVDNLDLNTATITNEDRVVNYTIDDVGKAYNDSLFEGLTQDTFECSQNSNTCFDELNFNEDDPFCTFDQCPDKFTSLDPRS